MRKSLMTGLAALAAGSLALAGCGGSDGGNEPVAEKDESAEITYGIWDENQRGFVEETIAEFNKDYPNVKVTVALTPYKQYWTKLQTQAEGGNLPDVFWMNGPNIELYAANDQLASLDDLEGVEWENFPESLVDLYSYDGSHYGVPKDFDTTALWYNEALFEQAGVDLPTPEWTWDDFSSAAEEISEKLDGVYGVVADLSGGQESFYNTIAQAGGYVIKDGESGFDDPKSIEGLQIWADLIDAGAMPTVQVMADNRPNDMFTSGKAAMIWAGTWNTAIYAEDSPNPENLNLTDLPRKEQQATTIHGLANVVAKNSENLGAAKAFVAHLATKKAAEIEGAAGVTLPAYNDTQDEFISTYPDWNVEVYTTSAQDYAVPYPVSMNTNAWATLEAEVLGAAFAGSTSVEDAAKDMAQKMNEMLARESQ
ncbi:MAG: sugar ABC transporter substrate-binding protein [Bowdeniella nasicola]|nr:sugar ABC transporter substrate-binding protein [Bowdeniella nasicola]